MGVRQLAVVIWPLCIAACAQGNPQLPGTSRGGRGIAPRVTSQAPAETSAQASTTPPESGAGMGAPEPPIEEPYTGEMCRVGAQLPCPCPDGVSTGVKTCVDDANSPTGGTYAACELCTDSAASAGQDAAPDSMDPPPAPMADPNAPPCENGVRDGEESDVDCGGLCDSCQLGRACVRGIDCASLSCEGGLCVDAQAPPPVMSNNPPPSRGRDNDRGGGSPFGDNDDDTGFGFGDDACGGPCRNLCLFSEPCCNRLTGECICDDGGLCL